MYSVSRIFGPILQTLDPSIYKSHRHPMLKDVSVDSARADEMRCRSPHTADERVPHSWTTKARGNRFTWQLMIAYDTQISKLG
jgi:hypothetical protein